MLRGPTLWVLAFVSAGAAGCLQGAPGDDAGSDPGTGQAAPRAPFTKLLCDAACNRPLGTATGPANEVALAMDPREPSRLLAGAKDYNEAQTQCVTVSWYWSEDGGRSWTDGYFLPPRQPALPHPPAAPATEPRGCESDPVPVFDASGQALMTTLATEGTDPAPGIAVYVRDAADGAWASGTHAYLRSTDKPWVAADPVAGRIYVVTRDDANANTLAVVRSADAGGSWAPVASLEEPGVAQVGVGPGGRVHLAGWGVGAIGEGTRIVSRWSDDGGATWSASVELARLDPLVNLGAATGGTKGYRTPSFPALGVARDVPTVAVAWSDATGDGWDVFIRVSHDAGETWGDTIRVTDDGNGADQWTPAVALSPRGHVHVAFFDDRHDPTGNGGLVDVYYTHSADGASFAENLRVTDRSFVPYLSRHQDGVPFLGDYLGLAASDDEAVVLWPDTRTGRPQVFGAVVLGG